MSFTHGRPTHNQTTLHAQKRYMDDYLTSTLPTMGSADVKVNDFIRRNIQAGTKDIKNMEFEKQRSLINRVHHKILSRKDYMLDMAGL